MRKSLRKSVVGLIAAGVLLASCVRMGEPDGLLLVTGDVVSVFATKQQSTTPSLGNRLTILEPDARVPVLDCLDEGDYSIYKIRLSDGRTGFVNEGDYRLEDKNGKGSVWCGAKPRNPQWQRGWLTDCVGAEFSKLPPNGAGAPGSERPVFKINPELVLVVPKKYWPSAGSLGHEPRACKKLSDLPTAASLSFYFQGKGSSGYNLSAVPTVSGSANAPRVRPDRVFVLIARGPSQPKRSAEERKQFEQIRRESEQSLNAGAHEIAGLKCNWVCVGANGPDRVSLWYWQRSASFVEIKASYKSSRYGGIQMWWETYTSDLAHWREIDDEVWKLIAEWNVLNDAPAAAGP